MNIAQTISAIRFTAETFKRSAAQAVNAHLTMRNWLLGFYIVHYEQNGLDRAQYGEKVLENLANELKGEDHKIGYRTLNVCRQFYKAYPQLALYVPEFLEKEELFKQYVAQGEFAQTLVDVIVPIVLKAIDNTDDNDESNDSEIVQTPSAQFEPTESNSVKAILQTLSAESKQTLEELSKTSLPAKVLVNKLAFSHFVELMRLSNSTQRAFYEVECIKGTWSVAELKRQIAALYYERTGMSAKPEVLRQQVMAATLPATTADIIKDNYSLEFLDLPTKHAVSESDLERALLDHITDFILELGNGFCFEARQKRLLIGEEYFFVDLVFYHRMLKCHVLIELKVEAFNHHNIGQLNTYVNYYNDVMKLPDDKPCIGILMVTDKNDALVKYALGSLDENLFVSQYQLQLPDTKKLEKELRKEIERYENE